MKKILILLLVLGMTSMANAYVLDLSAVANGNPYDLSGSGVDLDIGDTVDVSVVQAVENQTGSGGEMTITMLSSGGLSVDTTPGPGAYSPTTGIHGWGWLANFGVSYIDNGDGSMYAWFSKTGNFGQATMNGTPGADVPSYMNAIPGYSPASDYVSTMTFSFQVTDTTDLVWDGVWDGVDMDGVIGGTVNVVPEPMTIALLGLGGLFLRRRK